MDNFELLEILIGGPRCKCGHVRVYHKFPNFFRWLISFGEYRGECEKCDCKKYIIRGTGNS